MIGRRELLASAIGLAVVRPAWGGAPRRLITLGGTITETVFRLGMGAAVAGVDASSVFPEAAKGLPQLGYYRQLSAEGVLSLAPTEVLTTDEAGPAAALSQLASAGVRVHKFPAAHDAESACARVIEIGRALGAGQTATHVAEGLRAEFAAATKLAASFPDRPRVLFVLARGAGTATVSGIDTAAHAMIVLAGGANAVVGFAGYRPLTPEAAAAAAPDVILFTTMGLAGVGGTEQVWKLPGLFLTPAAKTRRLVVRDDLALLGFGPRAGAEVGELALALRAGVDP